MFGFCFVFFFLQINILNFYFTQIMKTICDITATVFLEVVLAPSVDVFLGYCYFIVEEELLYSP